MALIFSPLTEEVLQSPYEPMPRGAFLMVQLGEGVSELEAEMQRDIESELELRDFKPISAVSVPGHKDFLEKIVQLIRGCGFGVAIFSQYTPTTTMANIFFEIALCYLLGTPVVVVKTEEADAPSDLVRTEWVSVANANSGQLKRNVSKSLARIEKLAGYYETLGDIAIEAEAIDLELAFERYRQSFLIDGRDNVREKIVSLRDRARNTADLAADMGPAGVRIRATISEFSAFLTRA